MTNVTFGPIRFAVEHRQVAAGGGPTLRVYDSSSGRELLRFDCFAKNPHWHVDPGGRNVIAKIEAEAGPLDWVLGEVRGDLPGYLARAGFAEDLPANPTPALDEVEKALRNPPAS